MDAVPPDDGPVYSLSIRKALRVIVLVPLLAVFLVVLLHHKALINIEAFGIPENYAYFGFLGAALLAFLTAYFIWRCPGCGAYLGKKPSPERCDSCGAKFR